MSEWQQFLKQHKGKGLSLQQLSKKYCNRKLSEKIGINIREGKFSSRKQAIAVAYNQVSKKVPSCKRFFKRKSPSAKRKSPSTKKSKRVGRGKK